jgi:hypothetical protein
MFEMTAKGRMFSNFTRTLKTGTKAIQYPSCFQGISTVYALLALNTVPHIDCCLSDWRYSQNLINILGEGHSISQQNGKTLSHFRFPFGRGAS